MKLIHLYTNQPNLFAPIRFREGFNLILADIQHPQDKKKSGHNLGKSFLIEVLDFVLLKGVDKNHTFKKRADLFARFIFFLEIELPGGGFVTIRRSADEPTKIAFKKHTERYQNYSSIEEVEWDHWRESFKRAVALLDSLLAFASIKPFSYRKGVSFFLRTQQDYGDVFKLSKFGAGNHPDWKPYVIKVLGFDHNIVVAKYDADAALEAAGTKVKELQLEIPVTPKDHEKLKAQINIKRDEVGKAVAALDRFDFQAQETMLARTVAEQTEAEIATINENLYNARHDLATIQRQLADKIDFDLSDVQRVFNEAQISFPQQLARDYDDLVIFNRRILTERQAQLNDQAVTLEKQIFLLEKDHAQLSTRRREMLGVLGGSDSLKKFKDLQRQLDQDRADLSIMETRESKLREVISAQQQATALREEVKRCTEALRDMVSQSVPRYQAIQLTFARIIKQVMDREALLYVQQMEKGGNLDLRAEYSDPATQRATEEDKGTSFKQLLCIAFDLAVLISYAKEPFFHFVYHDGGLERLERKRKLALLEVIRETCTTYGIQYILTALSEDLPEGDAPSGVLPRAEEIVLRLNDGGINGRLFRMETF
ncbi:DUF2326 domain-containing protein [Brevifollis gellanilyticus]|uniref:DUF2326 domain-containing protein n=1 Tax=Brevifollis gellanilyticus TaxID=748831 RepID=A0A512MGK0_9BACT|nr:DUF2326 domain-containing protein [Brevifollis gellanilyticus]GEP45877.1 hypothetical protein BGE01nite_51680 [Brevifollis gellanilyticus]